MLDDACYYDFGQEQPIEWEVISQDEKTFRLKAEFRHPGGKKLLLTAESGILMDEKSRPLRIREFVLNGEVLNFSRRASSAYIGKGVIRRGLEVELKPGLNRLEAAGVNPCTDFVQVVRTALAEPFVKVEAAPSLHFRIPCPEYPEFPGSAGEPDLTGYTLGIGCTVSPGRFGFSKGDGYLDYAMPTLGNFDKMYLCGHPRYRKPFRWNYSTLPDGAARHGSYLPANHGIEADEIEINHLSCSWKANLDGVGFRCTGSLASPGAITERSDGKMRLGDLEFAGNYRYVMIPRKDGTLEICTLAEVEDWSMGKNFLLLFGTTEFPDLPLLLVFRHQPENIKTVFLPETGRLGAIEFENCPLLVTGTPFGMESFAPLRPDDREFLRQAAERCLFWSRAFLAFPVKCEEYYRNEPAVKRTSIVQRFSYRYIRDDWNTPPLELAPLPPVLSLCGIAEEIGDIADFRFPSKHGWLRGAVGQTSAYSLPWMPTARKFPLCSTDRGGELRERLKDGLQSYFDFVGSFPETTQAYPYAGAVLEPYAWTAALFDFLAPADREKLNGLLQRRLRLLCDPESVYDYPAIRHRELMKNMPDDRGMLEYYRNPELPHLKLWNWYKRVEPFTGTEYNICYLNVGFFSGRKILTGSREEILSLNFPLIENDWGLGLMFYYIYLACLASGDYVPVRENWELLNSAFGFFSKMHDWACMGTGYSEKAILWVEGANYGSFTSYINLAEAIGDDRACGFGRYLAAKQQALRHGILRSAQHYYCKLYGVEPWHIAKFMEEEANPGWQHMGVPERLDDLRYREEGVYNLTTEGLYPEAFESFREFQRSEYRVLMQKLKESLHRRPVNERSDWCHVQETASLLIAMALDPEVGSDELRSEIAFAKKQKSLLTRWRGIHIFSRRLPENYFETQLLAWDDMKCHPAWLEHWHNVRINSATLHDDIAEIAFEARPGAMIRLGCRRPPERILLNGSEISGRSGPGVLEIEPESSGELKIFFGKRGSER